MRGMARVHGPWINDGVRACTALYTAVYQWIGKIGGFSQGEITVSIPCLI